MVSMVELAGFEEFAAYIDNIKVEEPPIYFYFSGSKLSSGKSWCPDCVEEKIPCLAADCLPRAEDGWRLRQYSLVHYMNSYNHRRNRNRLLKQAEPVIKAYLNELNKNIIFVYVDVGDMATWKNPACPFRTHERTKLMVIPTIIKWKGVQRLEGSQCNKRDLLQMMFEEEE